MWRVCAALMIAAFVCQGQNVVPHGTTPKSKASGYPVHAQLEDAEIGAEYMVRTVLAENQSFLTDDYLVVEIAVFPLHRREFLVNTNHLSIRINGRDSEVLPQVPAMVAASLKYPDWTRKPQLIGSAGVGDGGIIIGRPRPVERFPGDRRAQDRLPAPPRVPDQPARAADKAEEANPAETVVNAALPEGRIRLPVSGFVYFPYSGKLEKLKSVELLVRIGSQPAVLRLR
jgi:hypothetical protein